MEGSDHSKLSAQLVPEKATFEVGEKWVLFFRKAFK